MNAYLIVKTLHIISATLMVGTGFGTAFYLFWANRSGSVAAQAVAVLAAAPPNYVAHRIWSFRI